MPADERIHSVHVIEPNEDYAGRIIFHLRDGRSISAPLWWSWRLEQAEQRERQNHRISPSGYRVRWPDIDEDLTTESLLNGGPSTEPNEVDESEIAEQAWPPGRISKLRRELGLSQQEFAERVGVKRQATVSNWETGKQTPSGPVLRVLDSLEASLERQKSEAPSQETKSESGDESVSQDDGDVVTYSGHHENVVDDLSL